MQGLRIGIIGIGGFGKQHLRMVHHAQEAGRVQLVAVAEKYPQGCAAEVEKLQSAGVKVYEDYLEMFDQEELDAVNIATPIPFHFEMAMAALERGIHVYLEKPPTVLIQELLVLKQKAQASGKVCAVGFQQISCTALRRLQAYLVSGGLGQVQQITAVGKWKRLDSYYQRANWAGRIKLGSTYVLDGPLSNALSHIYHNCLFLASSQEGRFAAPELVQAELYRAHPIEGEDTNAVFTRTDNGVEIFYYATLSAPVDESPVIKVYGTEGKATFVRSYPARVKIEKNDGQVEEWEPVFEDEYLRVFHNFLDAIEQGVPVYSSIEDTEPFVRGLNGAYLSAQRVVPIPGEWVIRKPEGNTIATSISDIGKIMDEASEKKVLFSGLGVPWAVKTSPVFVAGLQEFTLSFEGKD